MRGIREMFAVVGVVSSLGLACGGERTAPEPEASGADPAPSEVSPLPPPQLRSICPQVRTYLQEGSLHEEKWLDSQGRMTHWRSLGPEGGTESEIRSVYDSAGREVRRVTHTPQSDQISTWEYSTDGLLLAHYSNYPVEGELFTSGAGGRLLSIQTIHEGKPYTTESFEYDEAGHKLRSVEVLGDDDTLAITSFEYDEKGVLTHSVRYNAMGGTQDKIFDSAGRLLRGFDSISAYHSPATWSYYTYDEQGRMTMSDIQYILPYSSGGSRNTTHFTFDSAGRLALQEEEVLLESSQAPTIRQHHTFVFQYAPRLVRVDQNDENGVPQGSRELRYDDSGRLSEERFSGAMAQQQGSIQYAYPPCSDAE